MGGRRLPASGGAKNCLKERGGSVGKKPKEKSRQKKEERAGASGGMVAHWLPPIWNSYAIPRIWNRNILYSYHYISYGFVSQELIYY
jgi:hypothetical protein